MDLITAYLTTAWWVAALHGGFFLTCLGLWGQERVHGSKERRSYKKLWAGISKDASEFEQQQTLEARAARAAEDGTDFGKLAGTTLLMVKKGELPSIESIRARLLRSLGRHDPIVRACLNGFIISGLIGTLFNLWKLGPDFWAGLIQGQTGVGYPSIGIAFSASVFGLGIALFMTFVETVFVRRARESLVRDASAGLYDAAVVLLPSSESAAVAEALNRFYDNSTGFLNEFKSRHEEIAQQFTQQVQSSSDLLIRTLNDVSSRWESLTSSATERIGGAGEALEAEVRGMTEVTASARQAIDGAVGTLQTVVRVVPVLTELRAKVESLLAEITQRLSGFDEQWRADLQRVSQEHTEKLGEASRLGWERYEQEAAEWHRKNVEALQGFTNSIETSISQWGEERRQVGDLVDSLVEGWRRELGQIMTGMQSGLAQLRTQVSGLEAASTQLSNAGNSNVQQLNTLQNAVANISRNIVDGTPIGAALADVTRAVEELRLFLRDYKPPAAGPIGGGAPPPALDLGEVRRLLDDILKELRRSQAFRAAARGVRPAGDDGSGEAAAPVDGGSTITFGEAGEHHSLWQKLWPFGRKVKP